MARTFNGTSDKVTFGSESAVDDIAPFTAVALIRPTANITDERQILTKMDASWLGSMYLTAYAAGGGNNKVVVVRSGSTPLFTETAADVIVPSVWNVLVSTWNGVGVSGLANVYTCQLGWVITETSYTSRLMEPRRKFVYWKTSRISSCNSTGDRTNVTWLTQLT